MADSEHSAVRTRLDELGRLASDDFSQAALRSAALALDDFGNLLRLNFFCTAMRVLFEHTIDRLAPLDKTMRCSWYTSERENGEPTRAQRVKYVIQGGLADEFVAGKLKLDIEPLQKALRSTIETLGKQLHAREHTVVRDLGEQNAIALQIADAMIAFFETAEASRAAIVEPIQEALDDAAVDALLAETIMAVDELATHHSIEEIDVHHIQVRVLDDSEITYRALGTLSVGLQWGSNSDIRKGDGAETDLSFPFHCDITVLLDDIWMLEYAQTDYCVDTSSWTGEMEPDPWDP